MLTLDEVVQRLKEVLGDNFLEEGEFRGQRFVILRKDGVKEAIKLLKDLGFNHLQTLTGVDYLRIKNRKARFEVVYQLYSIEKRLQLRLRVEVPEDDPEVDSIVDLFPCANFLEREVYDLLGIRFKGHPNLKRILLPENWVGHPLRKDYPLEPEEKPLDFIELKKLNEELLKYGIK
ncbi:MAG: NADH-quinone oxidoreductase subunit C [Caldimicrobium sp.]|nr:NADH-quinone oxidoreductase subunit C [Caldimicrobium sp.]